DPFEGHVDHFNLVANGETKNAVGSEGSPIPSTPHDESGEFVSFTVNGNDTVFTAGEEDVEIKADEILAQIETGIVGDIPATCTPNGDSVLATVTVEDPEPEDTVAPEITLNGDNPMELEVGETYDEPGATAEDDVDGDVSDAIEGNGEGEEDTVAPEITLNGDNPMELEVGETYDEPGATAEDDVDGDVSDAIEVSGDVDTSTVGEYEVVYTVSDEAGNEATE